MKKTIGLVFGVALLAGPVMADQVIDQDLNVQGSLCVGPDCSTSESFGFDTIRLKSETPQIHFEDTSTSAEFPSTDWRVGISDSGMATPASFMIENLTSGYSNLVISPEGDVALGAGAELVTGAVSVGAMGTERRVAFVADGVDASDAVTLSQMQAEVAGDSAAIDAELDAMEARVEALNAKLDALIEQIN